MMHTFLNKESSSLLIISIITTLLLIVLNPLGTAHSQEVSSNTIYSSSSLVDGDLITTSNNPDIYIVKIGNGFKYKRLILNPSIFESYGHLEWSNVKTVSQETLNSFISSQLVREVNPDGSIVDGRIFMLFPNGDSGIKRHIQLDQIEFTQGGGKCKNLYTTLTTQKHQRLFTLQVLQLQHLKN